MDDTASATVCLSSDENDPSKYKTISFPEDSVTPELFWQRLRSVLGLDPSILVACVPRSPDAGGRYYPDAAAAFAAANPSPCDAGPRFTEAGLDLPSPRDKDVYSVEILPTPPPGHVGGGSGREGGERANSVSKMVRTNSSDSPRVARMVVPGASAEGGAAGEGGVSLGEVVGAAAAMEATVGAGSETEAETAPTITHAASLVPVTAVSGEASAVSKENADEALLQKKQTMRDARRMVRRKSIEMISSTVQQLTGECDDIIGAHDDAENKAGEDDETGGDFIRRNSDFHDASPDNEASTSLSASPATSGKKGGKKGGGDGDGGSGSVAASLRGGGGSPPVANNPAHHPAGGAVNGEAGEYIDANGYIRLHGGGSGGDGAGAGTTAAISDEEGESSSDNASAAGEGAEEGNKETRPVGGGGVVDGEKEAKQSAGGELTESSAPAVLNGSSEMSAGAAGGAGGGGGGEEGRAGRGPLQPLTTAMTPPVEGGNGDNQQSGSPGAAEKGGAAGGEGTPAPSPRTPRTAAQRLRTRRSIEMAAGMFKKLLAECDEIVTTAEDEGHV